MSIINNKKDLLQIIGFIGFVLFILGFVFYRYEFLLTTDKYPLRCSNITGDCVVIEPETFSSRF